MKKYFKFLFPFLFVFICWYISVFFINLSGILAIIPIFFWTFKKEIPYFFIYGLFFYFLIEFRLDIIPILSFLYYILYIVLSSYKKINIYFLNLYGNIIFYIYFCLNILILLIINLNYTNILNYLFIYIFGCIFYFILAFILRFNDD